MNISQQRMVDDCQPPKCNLTHVELAAYREKGREQDPRTKLMTMTTRYKTEMTPATYGLYCGLHSAYARRPEKA